MKNSIKILTIIFLAVVIISGCESKELSLITIGTGGVTGLYYPTGGSISRMLNKRSKEFSIKATVESTSGSVFNINAVLKGDMEVGITQSDRQYQAYLGLAEWEKSGPQKNLRSIFALHPEPITLVVSEKSGIKAIGDLKGKRINMGNPGSGQLQNSKDVIRAAGLTENDFMAEYVKAVEAPGLLQDERLDGFFYTVGHPNGNIKEATSGRIRVFIVPIKGNAIDLLVKEQPYYTNSIILREFYPTALNKEDIVTIGVRATLVTAQDVDEKIVYAITKVVFENFEEFKSLHPAYKVLTKENMFQGLTAPLHKGALKYYREAGLDQYIDPGLIIDGE